MICGGDPLPHCCDGDGGGDSGGRRVIFFLSFFLLFPVFFHIEMAGTT